MQESNDRSSGRPAKRGLDKGAELWHLVGMNDKKNIDGMIRYGYVDNESYDSRPNGWRVKGLNEPPKEIERSGEIEIESDREIERSIEIEIKIKEIEISMEIKITEKGRWKEIEKRKMLRVIGTSGPVKQLESDANNLRKERVSGSERATREVRDRANGPVCTLKLCRWRLAAAAAA